MSAVDDKERAIKNAWMIVSHAIVYETQPEMIAKVAESQLLRALWPDEFQGLYVDSEVASRDAQEDLNTAVSTSSSEPSGPTFDQAFADDDHAVLLALEDAFYVFEALGLVERNLREIDEVRGIVRVILALREGGAGGNDQADVVDRVLGRAIGGLVLDVFRRKVRHGIGEQVRLQHSADLV